MFRERETKEDWREDFDREVIRRSAVSDEELVRKRAAPYEPPAFEIREARERDEYMVTSREILDLYRLHSQMTGDLWPKAAPSLRPYYEKQLERVWNKLRWTIRQETQEAEQSEPFFDQGQQDFARKLEALWNSMEELGDNEDDQEHRFHQIEIIGRIIHSLHINGPLARYLVRDMRNLSDEQIKDFFDKLGNYYYAVA